MHKSKLKQMTLAISLACFSLYAEAAGLGKLTVLSGLGEPLNAEIEVESASPEELGSLSAGIASPEAYAVQGLQRTAVQETIQVAVAKKSNGTPILKLTSTQPVTDPFLEMLVQVDWSTGRLVREFTVLLDPPGYDSTKPPAPAAPIVAPEVPASESQPSTPPVADAMLTESSIQPMSEKAMPESAEKKSPVDEVKTARGDTLSKIAKEMQVEGVSLDRMLVGLYRENKEAFINNNMNQLKVGQIIKLPSEETLKSISRAEAAEEIKVHANDWSGYKNKLASTVAESKPAVEETKSQKSEGKLVTPKVETPAKPSEGPKDVVKLSKTEEPPKKGDAKTDAKTFRNKLDALQEEGLAREKSIKEASERAAALEKQVDDLQKLMTLKNKSMADVQKQATEATKADRAPKVVIETKKPEDVKPVPAPAEVKPTEVKPVEAKPAEAKPVEAEKPANPVVAEVDNAKKTPKKPKLTPKKATPEADPFAQEPSLMDDLDPLLLGGGAGALALLGGGWFYLRNRRKKSLDSFEKGILTAGALKANTVFGNTSGGTVDTGDTSFLTDFSQTAGGMIDTHDVDPIAEAEVYMAYGREAQAEEILKDAISKEPTRYELHLKLLEIYAARSDTSAFEANAGELYTTLGSSHPVWLKVAEMGHAMEPNNPLYDTASSGATTSAPAPSSEPVAAKMDDTQVLDVTDFAQAEEVSDATLDFSLDMDASAATDTNNAMDFEMESAVFDAAPDIAIPQSSAKDDSNQVVDEVPDLDFQLDMSALDSVSDQANQALEDVSEVVAEAKPNFEQTMPSMPSFETSALDLSDKPTMTATEDALSLPALDTPTDVGGLDFDFDLGESADALEPKASEPDFAIDDSNITDIEMTDIALDAEPASADGESEDVNTKLDLVTAYIDMGDNEGARELLDEIIKEGGPKQVARAKRLLADIA